VVESGKVTERLGVILESLLPEVETDEEARVKEY
jgi:hypothetical protein